MPMIMNYAQTLDMVEAFMEASGIRAFCTNMCKGDCCSGCYETKQACHRHEGRRMSCSIYLCYFKTTGVGDDLMFPFKSAERIIHEEARRVYDRYKSGRYTNSYFYPPPKQIFTEFEIAETPSPAYLKEGTRLTMVKAGLSLTYARKIRVIMGRIMRLAHEVLATREPDDHRKGKGIRLGRFEATKIKRRKRHVWKIKCYDN